MSAVRPTRGGARSGAGRKPGSGPFGEPTVPLRVPVSRLPELRARLENWRRPPSGASPSPRAFTSRPRALALPLYASRVAAGFPSPADDHLERPLDLNEHLVRHPAATYFVRVEGDSMDGAGICPGDILVVDRSLEPKSGAIVVAVVNGELTVKRLEIRGRRIRLVPENPAYPPLDIREGVEFAVWGVVVHAIRSF